MPFPLRAREQNFLFQFCTVPIAINYDYFMVEWLKLVSSSSIIRYNIMMNTSHTGHGTILLELLTSTSNVEWFGVVGSMIIMITHSRNWRVPESNATLIGNWLIIDNIHCEGIWSKHLKKKKVRSCMRGHKFKSDHCKFNIFLQTFVQFFISILIPHFPP